MARRQPGSAGPAGVSRPSSLPVSTVLEMIVLGASEESYMPSEGNAEGKRALGTEYFQKRWQEPIWRKKEVRVNLGGRL